MNYEKQIYSIVNFSKSIKKDNDTHAIVLVSKDSVLLDIYAKFLIMREVCSFAKKPCFECANCKKVINSTAIDVEVFGEGKNIVVADSAKIVADSIVVPFEFEKKYFVLKNFERATEQAQNKLLKVIEEPRSFDKFVILSSNDQEILPTIKSRAVIYKVPRLSSEQIFSILKYEHFDSENLKKSVEICDGSLSKCLKILNDGDYFEMKNLAEKVAIFMQSSANMLEFSSQILKFKAKISDFLEILSDFYVELLKIKFLDQKMFDARQNQLYIISNKYSQQAIVKIIEQINLAIEKAKINLSVTEIVDNLLLKILEIKYICKQ